MKRVSALIIILLHFGACFAANSIIAIVNEDVITLQSIEAELNKVNSFDEKIIIIEQQIDIKLQLSMAIELNLNPSQEDINLTLSQVANNNNLTIEQLQSYPQFPSLVQEITNKLSILNLQQFITKDLNIHLSDDEVKKDCIDNQSEKDSKQIKIAQIIVSQVENSDTNSGDQELPVRNFLKKLSDHITKGASFDKFAKLHSQHPSYANGGLSEWMFVNNSTIEMLDELQEGEVSEIYFTDMGWAIAIKVDERYVDPDLENCKEKIAFLKSQDFYIDWLEDLRDTAYIEIYTDKL